MPFDKKNYIILKKNIQNFKSNYNKHIIKKYSKHLLKKLKKINKHFFIKKYSTQNII